MRTAKKSIKRATKEAAFKAMEKHSQNMAAKGWKVDSEFGGDRGFKYECVTYFSK